MEEMNKEVINVVETVVEEVVDLTVGEKCIGYGFIGLCTVGAITIGSVAVKGGMKLYKYIKTKREIKNEDNDVEIVEAEIHEVKNEESEEN